VKEKTANKTAKPSGRNGNRLPLGNHAGNTGGKKGRSGRKPWAFRDEMRRALEDGKAGDVVQRIISGDIRESLGANDDGTPIIGDTKNSDRLGAIKLAASYAVGLPVQPVQDVTPREPAHLAANALLEAIPRLLGILPGAMQDRARLLKAIEVESGIVD